MLTRLFSTWMTRLPSQCAICHAWPAQRVCETCVLRFAQPRHRCRRCALPCPTEVSLCGACVTHPPPLDSCHAAVDYGYPWVRCIAEFKFQQQVGWAQALAPLMLHNPDLFDCLQRSDWLLPMPLAPARLQERGYNQALVLAHQLRRPRVCADGLLRLRNTPSQRGLSRTERQRNLRDALLANPAHRAQLQGACLVLIDDVMTTGASLEAAATALRAAGAREVHACVLARTPPEAPLAR
ncbi:phosphoribosyltransferase family protein [Curvibacter sp. HBC61]|uniref:Phosphoribosyltransferase family protein n=1 Tax=Curvibacter cyanobacteriorum TaxID=3026422 RepID=A0ABT5N050_9BURK|nr:phosphoribosyltransferase family protein [Curvibacter sp. HBC61]MDD0839697.1 phosphoribosyltransferase family protein [Curvibacter sp. HBC61]